MSVIHISETTYKWLRSKAATTSQTPDEVADELLRQQLAPQHAFIEVVEKSNRLRARIKGTTIPVSVIVRYLQLGETPETITQEVIPHLTLAQVYDALSYYHAHRDEIDEEIALNNDEIYWRNYLRESLGEEGYLKITGQVT